MNKTLLIVILAVAAIIAALLVLGAVYTVLVLKIYCAILRQNYLPAKKAATPSKANF